MLDDRQRQAVEAGPVDLFISAGAGSGKTRVLTARFVDAVLGAPPYRAHEPAELLTVTFTEKAAGELAERARRGLAAAGRLDLARRMGDAWVSTIHGMCSRILRQQALEVGIDPHFRTLDAVESGVLQMAAVEQALATEDQAALAFVDAYGYQNVAQSLRSVLADARSLGRAVEDIAVLSPAQLASAFREVAAECSSLADEMAALSDHKIVLANAACAHGLARVCQACSCEDLLPDVLVGLDATLGDARFRHHRAVEGHESLVEDARAALDRLQRLRAQIAAAEAERVFLGLLGEYDRLYAAGKQALGALDFEDLQLMTAELLERDEAIAERYRSRFAMVMLDEFQDTNELQLRIAELVSHGNLCTVGDENQSIYAFRHADIGVFRKRKAEVERQVRLDTNYRIAPPLLAALNGLFAGPVLFGDEYEALLPPKGVESECRGGSLEPSGQEGASSGADAGASTAPDVPFEVLLLDTSQVSSDDKHRREAEVIADRVAALVARGVPPGEIAVLMAAISGGRGERVESALLAQGIPVSLSAGGAFFSRPEVSAGHALLRTIDNPRDDEALVLLLAGLLGGVSPEGLLALVDHARELRARPGSNHSLWAACTDESCSAPDPDRISIARVVGVVERARRERGRLPLDELLRSSLLGLDADLVCLARARDGVRAWGNMTKLVRLAHEYQGVAHDGIPGFLRYLDQREMHSRSEAEAVLGSESASVRVMTVHAAKGLEFGHVIVGGLDGGGGAGSPIEMGVVDGTPLLGLKVSEETGSWDKTEAFERIRSARAVIDHGERRRLLYVAFTRAEHDLTVVVCTDPDKEAGDDLRGLVRSAVGMGAAGAIESATRRCGKGFVRVQLLQPDDVPETPTPALEANTGPVICPETVEDDCATAGASATVTRISYSGLHLYEQCPYRFYLTRVERLATRPERATGTAAALGTAVHAVLERIDAGQPIDILCDEAVQTFALAGPDVDRLRDAVGAFEAMEVRDRLRRATRVIHEAPLLVPIAGVVLTGSMDAFAREGERALVVDYKTGAGQPDEAAAQEAYRLQGQCYALAALAAGAAEVDVVFAETGPRRETAYRYRGEEREELESVVAGFIERMRAGEYQPRSSYDPHLCERCPGFGASCSVRS